MVWMEERAGRQLNQLWLGCQLVLGGGNSRVGRRRPTLEPRIVRSALRRRRDATC